MIQLQSNSLPALARCFPAGAPGPAALAEHVLRTGAGHWWADHAVEPQAVAVSCADHVLLRGDPRALTPGSLAPLAGSYIETPSRFLPALGASFSRIVPGERMVYIHRAPATSPAPRPPRGVTIRPLVPEDAQALAALGPDAAWLHKSWNGPSGLAASGLGRAAFHKDRILAVACTYFLGSEYEDIACFTVPEHRRRHLAHACVAGLCADIAARGRIASWSCSRGNRPSRLLAWTSGFRLEHEYVHYATGKPTASQLPKTSIPA
ncbi:GNAT family N-acetyltransferase [Streptomyces atratus]|uniref:GNAT family N-acetyltransferase n=1 Tax=Streptomyces atratus TaxID=1893 RepID=UPI00225B8CC3|nr:GNAT family N-acetyltransferase [Streptomyces atratus]MCX5339647.1 GNAT family N-acetyltransferase [Streptomyces atratus]